MNTRVAPYSSFCGASCIGRFVWKQGTKRGVIGTGSFLRKMKLGKAPPRGGFKQRRSPQLPQRCRRAKDPAFAPRGPRPRL